MVDLEQKEALLERIRAAAGTADAPIGLMEVCGTHTHAIARAGLRSLLPEGVKLISGPGCPVCVTSQSDIQRMIMLTDQPDRIVCTFGDMLRVPGNEGSLENARAEGADVRVVYSPEESLRIAEAHPEKQVVFLAVGFETTTPTIALTLKQAAARNIENFSVYVAHKIIPPAMEVVLDAGAKVNAFLTPGHVTVIIGGDAYNDLAKKYNIPCVTTGFLPPEILEGIAMCLEKVQQNDAGSFIQYRSVVSAQGNRQAQQIVAEVFEGCDAEWRGLGCIPDSGLRLRDAYTRFDAATRFTLPEVKATTPTGCICGRVLCGLAEPETCGLFGKACTPRNPVGPCMVSSEGTCAARYRYGG